MTETKPKPADSLRTPKAKKRLGLTVPPALRLPHEDLIIPTAVPSDNAFTSTSLTSQTSTSSQTSQTFDSNLSENNPSAAPQRDYAKVANSINRTAVPAGVFTGKSKQLYDCLYSITRGAVTATRTVRISRPKLMKKSGIGSRVTFDANIERLMKVGLISVRQIAGEHEGNEYTIYLPEETETSMTSHTSLTSSAHKVDRLVSLESSQTSHTLSLEESGIYAEAKTSFKTHDDETHTLSGFVNQIVNVARGVVGEEIKHAERERWDELGNVLADELKRAAEQTNGISSAPAFFTTHLRRRFAQRESFSTPERVPKIESQARNNPKTNVPKGTEDVSNVAERRIVGNSEAKSKFTLKQCRAWAEHLHKTGQGSTDPGGLAYKRFMDGTADELIEEFLNPPPQPPDKSQCPDCGGKGYYFPDPAKPETRRCAHERLRAETNRGV